MKKKVFTLIIILTAAIAVIAFKPSYAWVSENFNKSQKVDVGKLDYGFSGSIIQSQNIVTPELNLIDGTLTAMNKSTITTNIRVKIVYTYYDAGILVDNTKIYDNSPNQDLQVDFSTANGTWDYIPVSVSDPSSGCWLYKPNGASLDSPYKIPVSTDLNNGDSIPLIDFLGYSGINVNPTDGYEGQHVTIKVTIDAKQADYAEWKTIYEDYFGG